MSSHPDDGISSNTGDLSSKWPLGIVVLHLVVIIMADFDQDDRFWGGFFLFFFLSKWFIIVMMFHQNDLSSHNNLP